MTKFHKIYANQTGAIALYFKKLKIKNEEKKIFRLNIKYLLITHNSFGGYDKNE